MSEFETINLEILQSSFILKKTIAQLMLCFQVCWLTTHSRGNFGTHNFIVHLSQLLGQRSRFLLVRGRILRGTAAISQIK